jgi:hypothetical protein
MLTPEQINLQCEINLISYKRQNLETIRIGIEQLLMDIPGHKGLLKNVEGLP